MLEKLEQDPQMGKFKQDYKNLYLALTQSQERIKNYQLQFQELKDNLVTETYGVETAIQQSKNDEQLRKKINDQIEGVKNLVSTLKERDEKN